MYRCPNCDTEVQDLDPQCRRCDLDLAPLAELKELRQWRINRALAAVQHGDCFDAVVHLGAAIASKPKDVKSIVMLGKVYARHRRWESALECWRRALELKPRYEPAAKAIEAAKRQMQGAPGVAAVEAQAESPAPAEAPPPGQPPPPSAVRGAPDSAEQAAKKKGKKKRKGNKNKKRRKN